MLLQNNNKKKKMQGLPSGKHPGEKTLLSPRRSRWFPRQSDGLFWQTLDSSWVKMAFFFFVSRPPLRGRKCLLSWRPCFEITRRGWQETTDHQRPRPQPGFLSLVSRLFGLREWKIRPAPSHFPSLFRCMHICIKLRSGRPDLAERQHQSLIRGTL